ncbi:F0F1 ATP synthase subunit A [Litoreibacter arenae]|uniref:F0F1 ATP synthase subunit A n=1 Tax=Litoreibacter arenae DSM 19593 TaxID=1123360 RepID=S9QF69_9RHOB|nr:F0F1 ATP synthase subunit A [Litoreibacter arenae]EPX78228.1 F0F1 ATP synthase subunit A [Litoreibacter arenae DSM 19593]
MSMIAIDWTLFGFGALAGTFAAALFFAGLAFGMRLALRTARPTSVLLLSAALRIAALLGLVWWMTTQGLAALAGFALAFLVTRFVVLAFARPPKEAAPWS